MESDMDRMMRLPEVLEVTGLSHRDDLALGQVGGLPRAREDGRDADTLDWLALQRGAALVRQQGALRRPMM